MSDCVEVRPKSNKSAEEGIGTATDELVCFYLCVSLGSQFVAIYLVSRYLHLFE